MPTDIYVWQTNVDGLGHDGWKSTRGSVIVHGGGGPPPTESRFPGDPGVGNFYFGGRPDTLSSQDPPGWSGRSAAWDGWLSRMATWRSGKVFGVSRLYCDGDLNAGWSGGDAGSGAADMTRGMILSVSFKYPTAWGTGEAAMNTAVAFGSPWNTWMTNLANKIKSYAPAPIWITFFHEPEDHKAWTNGPANYRAINRRMYADLHALGADNFALVPGMVQCPYIYGRGGGPTDWNIYYPDWKGTYTNFPNGSASSAMNPNPVDYYAAGDPNSVVDVIGLDIYNWWNAERYKEQDPDHHPSGTAAEPLSNYQTFADMFSTVKGVQDFLGKPYAIGEFGIEAYHTGCYVPPNAGTVTKYTGTLLNPPGDAVYGTTNNQRTVDNLTGMGAVMGPYNIVALMVYNYMLSHNPWRLEYGDPDRKRYEGYGKMLAQNNCVMPVLTGSTPPVGGAGPVGSAVPEAGTGTGWTRKFTDEFTGAALDTTRWVAMNGATNNNMSGGSSAAYVSVHDGSAWVSTNGTNSGGQMSSDPLDGAGANGYTLPVGGYAEARIWFPGESGEHIYNWPAWWSSGRNWPTNGELDIAEGLGGDLAIVYHYGAAGQDLQRRGTDPAGTWYDSWHVYGVHRKSATVSFYYDGVLVGTLATSDSGGRHALLLTCGFSGSRTPVTGEAGAMQVDYVRAWEPTR